MGRMGGCRLIMTVVIAAVALAREARPAGFPVEREVVPGRLKVRIDLHDVRSGSRSFPCWSYVTDGLRVHRQKELVLTVRRTPRDKPEDYPADVLPFFATVYSFAEKGQWVDVGGISEFGAGSSFLGRADFKGVVYVGAEPVPGVGAGTPALAVLPLTGEELEVVKTYGATRVLAHLAKATSHYPHPSWVDRERAGVLSPEAVTGSVLGQMARLTVGGIRVASDGRRIVLRLPAPGRGRLAELLAQVPPKTGVALMTQMDPRADSCLVWSAGQQGPVAVSRGGQRRGLTTGAFVAFLYGLEADEGQLFEDGFVMMLTDRSWQAVRKALESGQPASVPGKGESLSLAVEWIEPQYVSPVDGQTYVSEDGWQSFGPIGSAADAGAPVRLERVVLLTSDDEMKARGVTVDSLAGYLKALQEAVRAHFAPLKAGAGQELVVECDVQGPGRAEVRVASPPGLEDAMLQGLQRRLSSVPVAVSGGVKVHLWFQLWGGSSRRRP